MHNLIMVTRLAFAALMYAVAIQSAQTQPWLLIDADKGAVIAQNEATRLWHPASIAKLMTVYTVFRLVQEGHIGVESPVRITRQALALPPSKMGFPVGTILTVDNAIKIIMVKSANDVALALAQSALGNEENFVAAMNTNARRLGMKNSHFTNPHGLPDINQVTTAADLGLLTLALQNKFPQFARYFKIHAIKIGGKRLRNHNALLRKFPGTNGMKTGFICASGLNIVARARRNGRQIIAIVLGGSSSLERNILAARLLRAGFADSFNAPERPTLAEIKPAVVRYKIPANRTIEICRPTWRERQMSKKQRRAARREHVAELARLRNAYLYENAVQKADIRISLGGATGPNPFRFKLVNGNSPVPRLGVPVWRPDRTSEPYEG